MTQENFAQSGLGRMDLLQGLRVGISGAVPEEQYWKRPDQNEQILRFVGLLSDLVMKYGGRIVHGNHPSFTPIIMGRANKHFGPRADGKSATTHPHPPPVTLVASGLWPLAWEFPLLPEVVDLIQTPRFGPGDVTDAETRNKSLTALRLVILGNVDIVISVGGKLHRGSGFNPGVLEELTIARWQQVPCIVVAGYGGFTGEVDRDVILQFCSESGLKDKEKESLASTDQEIDLCVGDIVAHLAKLVEERQGKAPQRRELFMIPIREPNQAGDLKIRVAEVTEPMVETAGKQFAEVVRAMEASNIDRIQELLNNPPSLKDSPTK
ncbi:MAG TPA: hypothetical protein VJY33_00975 [Isosphaeraceae bacterium]|nr:hypothetical protein [Isosphaeraceae bacterium]